MSERGSASLRNGSASGGQTRRRSFWGWGYEDQSLSADQREMLAQAVAARLDNAEVRPIDPPSVDEIGLRPPRMVPPDALAEICSAAPYDRLGHTYGKSFRDVVRALERDFSPAPDLVAFPRSEADVVALLDWCTGSQIAVIPYGGGSSVVGGVEPRVDDRYAGAISIDLCRLSRVLEIDRTSRAALIEAGALGPALEAQLRPEGYTLRHFPQSFEFSTLGGWIATRAGGHFATLYTHIDDFVESLRTVTPAGVVETRRLPGSGAGPSPDRLFIGSEGTLGVITQAWMRIQERPHLRATVDVRFERFGQGVGACRELAQSGLFPSNCRLLDATEALLAGGNGKSLLVLGFESADHSPKARLMRALEICAGHGGTFDPEAAVVKEGEPAGRDDAAGIWRTSFLRAPYGRDALALMGLVAETFETAVTWDRFEEFHDGVMAAAESAIAEVCGAGWVGCRFTHIYPDGPAPYYTVVAAGRRGSQIAQWGEIKAAASEAILRLGGTITHHHAIGRDHRPWYDVQRPEPFAVALRAAKGALDPAGVLNPGVLIDP